MAIMDRAQCSSTQPELGIVGFWACRDQEKGAAVPFPRRRRRREDLYFHVTEDPDAQKRDTVPELDRWEPLNRHLFLLPSPSLWRGASDTVQAKPRGSPGALKSPLCWQT